jgi:hypothetical protein
MLTIEYTPASVPEVIEERYLPGIPGYKVNNIGHLWSCKRLDNNGERNWKPKKMAMRSQTKLSHPVYATSVAIVKPDGSKAYKDMTISALVALAFIGPRPPSCLVIFKDGDRTNHGLPNLQYMTRSDAAKAGYLYTPIAKGETHRQRKKPVEMILDMRNTMARAAVEDRQKTIHALAAKYTVPRSDVTDIVTGKSFINDPGPITPYRVHKES